MPFVLDCSVTMAWILEDEATAPAVALLRSLADDRAVVPQLWSLEVANVLLVASRRGRMVAQDWPKVITALEALPIEVDSATHARALGETLRLAAEHDISVHDAAYLELARRRELPLATLDARLARACETAGTALALGAPPAEQA